MTCSSILWLAAAISVFSGLVTAQQPGNSTPEVHPQLTTWKCTKAGGCVAQNTAVVLDWNYRWIHSGANSCTTATGVNTTLCPNAATCFANCFIEGVNYTAAGVTTSGDALTMNQYMLSNGTYSSVSPRVYLIGSNGNYEMLQLNGQELSFDVDLSTLPCGENGALYLSQMSATGGLNQYDTAGANYGGGYCDAQCPVQNWINGTLNTNHTGFCCTEMDILEANSRANAFTPHPCSGNSCDSGGCGFNPYAQGFTSYYGPGDTVDTSKVFTVTTQFITQDGTTTGPLTTITRKYIQNGVQIHSAVSTGDSLTATGCTSGQAYGGFTTMGNALASGMVLVFSIWNDNGQYMNWLDSGSNGPCSSTAGNPATIVAQDPTTHVIFSNIRWGDIGSTTPGGSTTTTTSSSSTSTTSTTTASAPTCTATHYSQCAGIGYSGCTTCASPYTCQYNNPYYSQCL